MIMERTRRVFQFEGEPKKRREEPEIKFESAGPSLADCERIAKLLREEQEKIGQKPRTVINWAPDLPTKAIFKIRFLLENLPSLFHEMLYKSGEARYPNDRNWAGAQVFEEMRRSGYDFRRISETSPTVSFSKQEFYELWKADKCIARLVIDANGEAKMVKVM